MVRAGEGGENGAGTRVPRTQLAAVKWTEGSIGPGEEGFSLF